MSLSKEEIIRLRQTYVTPSLSVHYSQFNPLHIVRGDGLYLIDETDQPYLDCINNIALVGHSHPRLVEAFTRQKTNPGGYQLLQDGTLVASRELWERYRGKILGTLPGGNYDTILFTRSGSEANDLALSIAEAFTGHTQVIALDGAYHGHSANTMGLSTYKLRQSKTDRFKLNPTTIIAPKPDIFQGDYNDPLTAGVLYANDIKAHMEKEMNEGRHISAFISEPFLGTAGQVPLPEGYLKAVYNYVREAGGLCIIDEVQTGFGRAGTTFWMHQLHDVIPDIVVMGKPVANGHPLSALITRWDIARKFFELNGEHLLSEFFTDCVSLGLAETIFDIIVDEGLQQNAVAMGQYVVDSLKELKHKYHCIGDVRGTGLFIGMEIIRYENEFKYSDGHTAKLLVKKALLEHNVLLKEDGVDHNVIKIKPPLCFSKENADQLIRAIDQSLYGICSN